MKTSVLNFLIMVLLVLPSWAQDSEISGTVTDNASGDPLPGVTVQVQGTGTGTVTGLDGKYSIPATTEDVLLFSFIGYQTAKETVGNRSSIDVALGQDVSNLDEVVVVGYSSQKKSDMTGAIVAVDLTPIEGQSMSNGNPMQALQGRVPGLYVEKSGDPSGASSRVLIRGDRKSVV